MLVPHHAPHGSGLQDRFPDGQIGEVGGDEDAAEHDRSLARGPAAVDRRR